MHWKGTSCFNFIWFRKENGAKSYNFFQNYILKVISSFREFKISFWIEHVRLQCGELNGGASVHWHFRTRNGRLFWATGLRHLSWSAPVPDYQASHFFNSLALTLYNFKFLSSFSLPIITSIQSSRTVQLSTQKAKAVSARLFEAMRYGQVQRTVRACEEAFNRYI